MRALLHTAWSTTLRGDGARRQMGRGLTLELKASREDGEGKDSEEEQLVHLLFCTDARCG